MHQILIIFSKLSVLCIVYHNSQLIARYVMPLEGKMGSLVFSESVIEKIARRVEGWHRGCLSRGGKLF